MARSLLECLSAPVRRSAHQQKSIGRINRLSVLGKFMFCVMLVLPLTGIGLAQTDPAAGILPFSTHVGGQYDSVDLATGNISLLIPVRDKTGKSPFSFKLIGNSHAYMFRAGWWGVSAGLSGMPFSADLGADVIVTQYSCDGGRYIVRDTFAVTDATGAAHPAMALESPYCGAPVPSGSGVTSDGSGYTVVYTSGVGSVVYDRSGNKSTGTLDFWWPATATLTDPDGVTISSTVNQNFAATYTDTLGMVALTATPGSSKAANGTPDVYAYTDENGNSQTVQVNYSPFTGQTNFRCSGINEEDSKAMYLPTSISFPDGETLGLSYEPVPGFPGNGRNGPYTTGRIAKIMLPTGGSVSYEYSGGNNGVNCISYVVPTLTRTEDDNQGHVSTWTYVNSDTSPSDITAYFTVTETDAASNQTVFSFSGMFGGEYQTEKQVYQGSVSPANLVATQILCYNGNFTACATAYPGPVVTQTDLYTYLGNSSSPSLVETKYDTYGNVSEIKKYDYGALMPPSGAPVSDTTMSYNGENGVTCGTLSNAYMHDRPCTVRTVNASGQTVSQTQYTYSTTGHVTQTQRLVRGTTYLTSYASYNTNGTAATVTDANGTVSTYGYGGTGGCNGLLPTSVAAAGLTTSIQWNCNGAAMTKMADANGQPTSFTYADPLWRVTSVTDPLGNTTNDNYTPNTFESWMNFNGAVSTTDALATTDGLGRTIVAQKHQGQGAPNWDSTQTAYGWNSTGALTTQSTPYSGAAGAAAPSGTAVTTTQHDALGRPLTVTDGGGGTTSYTYLQNDVLQKAGPTQTFQKQFEYDGLGRVTSVCEITSASGSGSCGQSNSATGFLTKYTYDASGNLLTVTQNAQPGAIGGIQTRSYAYDGLGRMTSESNPETGTIAYTFDTDSTCGTSNGDTVKKVDAAGNVTCYAYDGLHRMAGITYPSGPYAASTPPKTFVYDATTFSCTNGSNVKGRLAEAFTGPSTAKIADIAYCYSPRGETTDVFESTPNSGGYYHTTASYWANGATETLGGVPGLSTWAFTPDGEGRPLTATWGTSYNWVTGTTYYPTYPQTSVTFGNGDSDIYGYDTNTGRMNQFRFTVGATPKTLAGAVGWNPNGTLGTLGITDPFNASNTQNCSYGYDDLARMSGVNCVQGSTTTWNQSFSPDAFGNLSKSGSSSFVASYMLANGTTNNQVQSVGGCVPTYDANGNLTKDCTNNDVYAWDANGNPTSLNGVKLTYDALDREVEIASGSAYTQVLYSPIGKLGLMQGQTPMRIRVPLPGGSTAELIGATGGTLNTLHSDWLGSARLSTTYTDRGVAYDSAYAPYSESYAGSGGSSSDLDFTGQFQDTLSGLYDFQYREYSPAQGRWISPDPSGLNAVDPSNPQSWNRYAYVFNNPLKYTDPNGLWCVWDDGTGHDSDPNQGGISEDDCADAGGHWDKYDTITNAWQYNGIVTQIAYTANGQDYTYQPYGMTLAGLDSTLNGGYSVMGYDPLSQINYPPASVDQNGPIHITWTTDPPNHTWKERWAAAYDCFNSPDPLPKNAKVQSDSPADSTDTLDGNSLDKTNTIHLTNKSGGVVPVTGTNSPGLNNSANGAAMFHGWADCVTKELQ